MSKPIMTSVKLLTSIFLKIHNNYSVHDWGTSSIKVITTKAILWWFKYFEAMDKEWIVIQKKVADQWNNFSTWTDKPPRFPS